jgi:hypothetical protein
MLRKIVYRMRNRCTSTAYYPSLTRPLNAEIDHDYKLNRILSYFDRPNCRLSKSDTEDNYKANMSSSRQPLFPVENSLTSYWMKDPHPLASYRTCNTVPGQCDIAIIGTGMCGVATAYHILSDPNNGPEKPTVVLLEARQVCSGATGRNGEFEIAVYCPLPQNLILASKVAIPSWQRPSLSG